MQLIPFRKKRIWVAGTTGKGQFDCLCLKHARGSVKVEEHKSCKALSELPARAITLVIHSERLLISTESFPPLKEDILQLQAEERIRNLGPWNEDTPLSHCIHLREKGSSLNSYTIISLPQSDIEQNLKAAQEANIRITRCLPHVASISALTGRLTNEPVMVCFLAMGYLEILVAEKGIPYYSQISPIDLELGMDLDLLSQAIFSVRQIISARYNKEVQKVLFLSKEEGPLPDKIGEEEVWQPQLKDLVGEDDEAFFWKYPELIGAPFVSEDFDCLPKQLKTTYLIQDLNKAVAGVAAAGLVLLGASSFFLVNERSKALSRYNRLYSATLAKKAQVDTRMPRADELKKLTLLARVWDSVRKEGPIDRLLYAIASHIPENVVIQEMSVKREGGENRRQETQEIPPPEHFVSPQSPGMESDSGDKAFYQRPLVVHLELYTKGQFQEVKTRLQRAVNLLGRKFAVSNVTMKYQEDQDRGYLHCDLLKQEVKGG